MTAFNPREGGFAATAFLPILTVLMTGAAFFALTATAVKKKTESQSSCLKINIKTQKKLSLILKKLLALNKASQNLHLLRTRLAAAKAAALFTANAAAWKAAEKALRIVKTKQKALKRRQEALTDKSEKTRAAALKEFRRDRKGRSVRNIDSFSPRKALAVQKKKIGQNAFIYEPEIFFSKKQALKLSWEQDLFAGTALKKGRALFGLSRTFVKDDCAATLEKTTWEAKLSL